MTRKSVGRAVAVAGDLPEDQLLGRLVIFSIPDTPVSGAKLVRSWNKHGLDVSTLPDARQPVHIFQSACRSVESRKQNGKNIETKVDEVLDNGVECVYQITRLVRDQAEKLIEHPKAMTLAFEKAAGTIEVRELEDYDQLAGVEEKVREHFEANAKTVPGQKVRNAVRDAITRVGAQNMRRRGGGVYFVPREWKNGTVHPTLPILESLQGVLADLYAGEADFDLTRFANGEGEHAMVRKHFAINAAERSQALMERAIQRVRTGPKTAVRTDFLTNLHNERRALVGQVKQFEELVGFEREAIAQNLDDLDAALAKLEDLNNQIGASSA